MAFKTLWPLLDVCGMFGSNRYIDVLDIVVLFQYHDENITIIQAWNSINFFKVINLKFKKLLSSCYKINFSPEIQINHFFNVLQLRPGFIEYVCTLHHDKVAFVLLSNYVLGVSSALMSTNHKMKVFILIGV